MLYIKLLSVPCSLSFISSSFPPSPLSPLIPIPFHSPRPLPHPSPSTVQMVANLLTAHGPHCVSARAGLELPMMCTQMNACTYIHTYM